MLMRHIYIYIYVQTRISLAAYEHIYFKPWLGCSILTTQMSSACLLVAHVCLTYLPASCSMNAAICSQRRTVKAHKSAQNARRLRRQ